MPQKLQDAVLNEIHEDPSSPRCLSLAATWLDDCLKDHGAYSLQSLELREARLPTRVIDVGDELRDPILYEPTGDRCNGQWASLSYCWGGVKPSIERKRESDMELQLRRGVPIEKFDRTIINAIMVTRALGIPFLWVGALGIYQDADSKDWNKESSKMNEIYGKSTITVAAASSKSVTEGFLRRREGMQFVTLEWRLPVDTDGENGSELNKQYLFLSPAWNADEHNIKEPLTRRG